MKNIRAATFVILTVFATLSAQAVTIDFESTGTPGHYNNLDYVVNGFVFNSTMDNIDLSSPSWSGFGPAHSGNFAALNNSGGAGAISLANNGVFSFQSLWIKNWSGSSVATVTGFLDGTQVGTVSLAMGTGWTNIVGNFSNINSLKFSTGGTFLVDDLSVTAVPEPETYAMLLAGLGLMGAIGRRRKNRPA